MKKFQYRHIKKTIVPILVFSMFMASNISLNGQSIYSDRIESIDGKSFQLQSFAGKKILIFILPVSTSSKDSLLMFKIDSAARSNSKFFQTIVVPSYELGYSKEKKLDDWYRYFFNTDVIISKPVFTHIRSSKSKQDPFFYWLTHADSNGHFDNEITGPGALFLIDEQGLLEGTFDSQFIQNSSYWSIIFKKTN